MTSDATLLWHLDGAVVPLCAWRPRTLSISGQAESQRHIFGFALRHLQSFFKEHKIENPPVVTCYKQQLDPSRTRQRRPVEDVVELTKLISIFANKQYACDLNEISQSLCHNEKLRLILVDRITRKDSRKRHVNRSRRDESDRVKQRLKTAQKQRNKEREWEERGKLVESWRKQAATWEIKNQKAAEAETTEYKRPFGE